MQLNMLDNSREFIVFGRMKKSNIKLFLMYMLLLGKREGKSVALCPHRFMMSITRLQDPLKLLCTYNLHTVLYNTKSYAVLSGKWPLEKKL